MTVSCSLKKNSGEHEKEVEVREEEEAVVVAVNATTNGAGDPSMEYYDEVYVGVRF